MLGVVVLDGFDLDAIQGRRPPALDDFRTGRRDGRSAGVVRQANSSRPDDLPWAAAGWLLKFRRLLE